MGTRLTNIAEADRGPGDDAADRAEVAELQIAQTVSSETREKRQDTLSPKKRLWRRGAIRPVRGPVSAASGWDDGIETHTHEAEQTERGRSQDRDPRKAVAVEAGKGWRKKRVDRETVETARRRVLQGRCQWENEARATGRGAPGRTKRRTWPTSRMRH